MLEYGKEEWFRRWISSCVLKTNLNDAVIKMKEETGVTLNDEQKEYYQFLIDKMRFKVQSVCELNYNKELVNQMKDEKLGDKILRAKDTISNKFVNMRKFVGNLKREDQDVR